VSARPALLLRLPNWVGDVCMCLPTLHALHEVGFALQACGRGWAKELLAGMPVEMLPLRKRGILAQAADMRASTSRHALLFTNSLSSALAARLAGLAAIGYRGEGRWPLLAKGIPRPTGGHEVATFWRLGTIACERWASRADWPGRIPDRLDLPIPQDARETAGRALDNARITTPYWACAPLAQGTIGGLSKIWPHWRELAQRLADTQRPVVACPGPGEEDACRAALPGARILPGLGLASYAAVLGGAEQVVANDSGPMHLAAAAGAPVFGIFGPGDPDRTAPWGGRHLGGRGRWPSLAEACRALDLH